MSINESRINNGEVNKNVRGRKVTFCLISVAALCTGIEEGILRGTVSDKVRISVCEVKYSAGI
jgi:hypothetical protein